ncbi:MAG TPA: MaoC family dehydratase [Vicinamibacterales bacterium]|nr:MaoC family dehydratase [Vicinamibacterales bacterium]
MITLDVRTLRDRVGQEIAVGDWTTVSQAQIDQFAEATGDRQWIHVDAARAAAESPFKTTIAHGFLTLSLLSSFLREAIAFTGVRMALNYGLNKVRFVSPVQSGSRVRARIVAGAFEEVGGGAIQITWNVTIERQSSDKPAGVAEWIVRYYPEG